jgi:hypothetical protein
MHGGAFATAPCGRCRCRRRSTSEAVSICAPKRPTRVAGPGHRQSRGVPASNARANRCESQPRRGDTPPVRHIRASGACTLAANGRVDAEASGEVCRATGSTKQQARRPPISGGPGLLLRRGRRPEQQPRRRGRVGDEPEPVTAARRSGHSAAGSARPGRVSWRGASSLLARQIHRCTSSIAPRLTICWSQTRVVPGCWRGRPLGPGGWGRVPAWR